jgi:hypothetical protein
MTQLIQFEGCTVAVIAPEDLEAQEAELAALRERVAELEADAERYRWMKRVHEHGDESVTEWVGYYRADQWDEEIDKHRASASAPSVHTPVPDDDLAALTSLASMLDTIKSQDWAECWSAHDQGLRDWLTRKLRAAHGAGTGET